MRKLRIALADDHPLIREILKKTLSEQDMEVVAEAPDGVELLDVLSHLPVTPDIVILDFAMPRLVGPEVARYIRQLFPQIKILMLTMRAEKEYAAQAFAAGVNGYLLKEESVDELFVAIHAVCSGKRYSSPRLAA